MKYTIPCIFLFITLAGIGRKNNSSFSAINDVARLQDTLPDMCNVVTDKDIAIVKPFTSLLTNIFPDPNNYEIYRGCFYQFYTATDYPQIAVKMIKRTTKDEAIDDFKMQVQRHVESWGMAPEFLYGVADSAYFTQDGLDSIKCDECGLVARQGLFNIYISFKGGYENASRERKKESALKILQLMYDRIPGLKPRPIPYRQ